MNSPPQHTSLQVSLSFSLQCTLPLLFISLAFPPFTRWLTHLLPLSFPRSPPPSISLSLSSPLLCASCGRHPSSVHTGPSVPSDACVLNGGDTLPSCNDCVFVRICLVDRFSVPMPMFWSHFWCRFFFKLMCFPCVCELVFEYTSA